MSKRKVAGTKTGSLPAGKHLISSNPSRNMGMFVYVNEGPGGKDSITRHEPLESDKPFRPYKRERKVRVGGATIAA